MWEIWGFQEQLRSTFFLSFNFARGPYNVITLFKVITAHSLFPHKKACVLSVSRYKDLFLNNDSSMF